MKAVATLVRIGHDNLENRNPFTREEIETFECVGSHPHWRVPDSANEFLGDIEVELYVGYDNKVYPKYKFEIRTFEGKES